MAVASERGAPLLVLGGDCTVELGTTAGHADSEGSLGPIYFEVHPDLNTPGSTRAGAFDWMGVAHMLGVEGADPDLAGIGPRTPLLDIDQLMLFGWDAEHATPFERDQIERRRLTQLPLDAVAADPKGRPSARSSASPPLRPPARALRRRLRGLHRRAGSENTGRNEGLPLDDALRALRALLASPKLGALTVTELNPCTESRTARRCGALSQGWPTP